MLGRAEGRVAPGAFSRAAAELADLAGDLTGALERWREVLAREPLNAVAHRAVARLLEETDPRGPAAAKEHLDDAVARFPHAVALHEQRIAALNDEPGRGSPGHAAAVDALLAVQPGNLWAWRERALGHEANHELPDACAALDEAERLDPFSPAHPSPARAAAAHRRAPRRGPRQPAPRAGTGRRSFQAFHALLDASPVLAEKREALDFMHAQLVRQPFVGDGVLAYREGAYPILGEAELRGQIDAILAARPDLWQAWSAAVWQHADAHRLEDAHAHAAAATERFPLLARVWMDLAAIEKIRGDDRAQVAALERALRISSTYGNASRRLAAAHRRGGCHAEARTVLEAAIAAAPLDVANRGALAETLWQEDRAAHGARVLEILADAVRREPGYDWAWDMLERCARTLEKPDLPETTARRLTTTRPGEARSWLRLATTLPGGTGAARAERLDALERALKLNPRCTDAHDLRAVILAGAGRYDEALAACVPPPDAYPGGTHPHNLDGRAAWVLARRGDFQGARERMRRVVADHPGYEWGWRMLADWAEAANDAEETLAAAERVAFLSPHSAPSQGYLAAARLALKMRAGAKTALKEAMGRDPAYFYAPVTLMRVQLEDGEFDEAEETLKFFGKHHPGPPTLGRTVLLAAKRRKAGDRKRAADALAELARTRAAPGTDDGNLTAAVNAMTDAYWNDQAEAALEAAVRAPETANPDAGALWVRLRGTRGKWRGLGRAVRRMPEGEFARRTRLGYLAVMAEQRRGWSVTAFVRRMRRTLRADTESWGQTGYALLSCGFFYRTIRWLADWAERPDAEGWMLANLAVSLRAWRRHRRAVEVNRHALTLPPDRTRPKHLAWVALEDALTDGGEARARAERFYAEAAPLAEKQEQPFRYLDVLTGQVLAVRAAAGRGERRAAYREARAVLRRERVAARAAFQRGMDYAARRAERRARQRMAKDVGAWGRWMAEWIFAPPALPLRLVVFLVVWIVLGMAVYGAVMDFVTR